MTNGFLPGPLGRRPLSAVEERWWAGTAPSPPACAGPSSSATASTLTARDGVTPTSRTGCENVSGSSARSCRLPSLSPLPPPPRHPPGTPSPPAGRGGGLPRGGSAWDPSRGREGGSHAPPGCSWPCERPHPRPHFGGTGAVFPRFCRIHALSFVLQFRGCVRGGARVSLFSLKKNTFV